MAANMTANFSYVKLPYFLYFKSNLHERFIKFIYYHVLEFQLHSYFSIVFSSDITKGYELFYLIFYCFAGK